LRNKTLYIYTENLNFFYRLNKELKQLGIKFTILNTTAKIPDNLSLILTTLSEISNIKNSYNDLKFLPYSEKTSFKKYILKVLSAYRIGYKESYSHLIFSIDPGSKYIGIIIFLDDFYLMSQTLYEKRKFIEIIKNYVNCFQNENSNALELTFKFGSGVLSITIDLIKEVYNIFKNRKNVKVFLIDESKSSKLKLQLRNKGISKHEISALILALRHGVEVNESNYFNTLKQIKCTNSNIINNFENDFKKNRELSIELKDIIKKILNSELSLSSSSSLVRKAKKVINF